MEPWEQMGLNVVFSNRMEILGRILLAELDRIPMHPLTPQHIIVPSTAVARYLQLAIARNKGVCANIKFAFLGGWLWQLAGKVEASVPERSPLAAEILVWHLLRLLEEHQWNSYPRLASFLAGADELMRLDLARTLARVFDHYATYRPDWLTTWSAGGYIPDFHGRPSAEADEDWQRALWRRLTEELDLGGIHPLEVFIEKTIAAGRPTAAEAHLPESAAVFAVPSLPSLYLRTLCRLSELMDITLYLMNPCREYWFEIVPPARLAYLQNRKRDGHREIGHSLLADWGRATQAAIDLVYEEAVTTRTSEASEFHVPEGDTLLRCLQRSLLDLEELMPGSLHPNEDDRSIEIHCCHSAFRELEVLHDRLLMLFGRDDTLRAEEVAVLTPDIDALAPMVDAVFGAAPSARYLPYAVSGRSLAGTNPYLRVLNEVLELLSSRLPAGRIFALLRQEPVARRYGLDEEGLSLIRKWLRKAGMHWGLDGAHRGEWGLPKEERHTLRRGLDSLFLGLALPELDAPLGGLLPADSLEGARAAALGKLWRFISRLSFWKDRVTVNPAPEEWQDILNGLLTDFTRCGETDHGDYDRAVGIIASLAENWRAARLTRGLSAKVVRAALLEADDGRRGATPTGSITFASLAALRGLGYRVICLVGMNDLAFPSREHPPEFDLIPKGKSRRGDRQRRREDRGVFLDALLAAGEILHISYTGRDRRDNAELPPSVLVSQLRDYLARALAPADPTGEEMNAARARLTVEHPLQPFSRRYFDASDPRLVSHNEIYAAAIAGRDAARKAGQTAGPGVEEGDEELPPPFFTVMPDSPEAREEDHPRVTTAELAAFLENPSRFFIQRRLHVQLIRPEETLEDEEPLTMGFSEDRRAAEIVAATAARGRRLDYAEALDIIGALPDLPAGAAGEAGFARIWPTVDALADRLLRATAAPRMNPRQMTLLLKVRGKTWELIWDSQDLRPTGIVRYRCDALRGYDHLGAWIHHLALCAARPEGVTPATTHLAFDNDLHFAELPPTTACDYLAELIALYERGLGEPTPFFRRASWEYAVNVGNRKITAARNKWRGSPDGKSPPEKEDPWHALLWRGVPDPLDDDFARIAGFVFDPILLHRRVVENTPAENPINGPDGNQG